MQYYDALGLAPKLSLDAADLKKRFYERSREWHPDRFARQAPDQQKKSLDMTALLNDAFRTLREPIGRAEYFLEEHHLPPTKTPPPELLEEVFELNMALEELRDGDESARGQLVETRERFLAMRGEIDDSLAALFEKFDAAGDEKSGAASAPVLSEIRAALDRRRYVSNLLRDVDKQLPGGGKESADVQLSN